MVKVKMLSDRVFLEDKDMAPEEAVKVYVVVNRIPDEHDVVLHVFKHMTDAIDYASAEAEMNVLDDYVVIKKELV